MQPCAKCCFIQSAEFRKMLNYAMCRIMQNVCCRTLLSLSFFAEFFALFSNWSWASLDGFSLVKVTNMMLKLCCHFLQWLVVFDFLGRHNLVCFMIIIITYHYDHTPYILRPYIDSPYDIGAVHMLCQPIYDDHYHEAE